MKMNGFVAFVTAGVVGCSSLAYAQSDTEKEVEQAVVDRWEHLNTTLKSQPEGASEHGTLAFWSSGGLLQEEKGLVAEMDLHNVQVKHIKVITLVEGQAAVAHYYLEGTMKAKGESLVSHYLVRATMAFVSEDGKWKRRAGHFSPIVGGSGISSAAPENK